MTRAERRQAMPNVTSFIDSMRADFPELRILYASENGQEWGERQPEGVLPVLTPDDAKAR